MKVIRYANPEGELGFAQLREDGVPTVLQFVDGVFVGTDTPASIHHHLWPVDVQTIFAIGLNYQAHAERVRQDPSRAPDGLHEASYFSTSYGEGYCSSSQVGQSKGGF